MPPPPPPWFKPEPDKSEQTFSEACAEIFRSTLSRRHQADKVILGFILKYIECRHPGEAGREVGITAHEGRNLLKHKDVYAAICKITEISALKYGYEADELVERVKEIVDFDPIDLYDDDGNFKRLQDMPASVRRVFKKFKLRNIFEEDPNGMKTGKVIGETLEVEVYEKYKGVELMSREKNVFKDTKTIQHDISENMGDILLGSVERSQQRQLAMTSRDVSPTEGETVYETMSNVRTENT